MGMLMARVGGEIAPSRINVGGIAEMMRSAVEALVGAPSMSLLTFKCPSGGGKFFACDDEEMPPISEIEGIIISAHYNNVYWSTPMGEGNREPDCVSRDGLSGWYTEDGEITERSCAACPYNKMGSAPKGRGKACRNRVELLMLVEGSALPVKISVPTMSVENYGRYYTRELIPRGVKNPWQVSTKITLKNTANAAGTKYAQMVFSCTGRTDDAQMAELIRDVVPILMGSAAQGGQADE